MVISRDVDFENIEKTHSYNGLYFVLGGSIPILEKEPETRIRQKELLLLVESLKSKVHKVEGHENQNRGLKEVILATNLNPEGENTAEYIEKILAPLAQSKGFKISHLGKGLSTGTELEYSDTDTIKNALKNRN
ncbi:MAG: toprim domain-containing protein [Parcubacteria group bacterium]|nr:toprim domain-containing protein [Parcubacteria group bacterium]